MVTELFANNASTTLAAGITAGATTVTVASSTGFPAAVAGTSQFRVICGTEIMVVTAVAGATWTVTRGAESTAAATHATGDPVTAIITAGSLGVFPQTAGAALQTFTGSGTWTKPAGATWVQLLIVGAGGGGGSGRRGAAGTVRCGGGGGGPGAWLLVVLRASDMGTTWTVTVGAGGPGGAAVTADSTNGNPGTDGGLSEFYALGTMLAFLCDGGLGGAGGTATTGAAGAAGPRGTNVGGAGGAASTSGGTGGSAVVSNTSLAPGGGGAGGGVTTGDVAGTGGRGAAGALYGSNAGGTGGGAGVAGAVPVSDGLVGRGGGGGGGNTTGAGGNGGNGSPYGGGGGGGGAVLNGNNSGAGGTGSPAVVVITTW